MVLKILGHEPTLDEMLWLRNIVLSVLMDFETLEAFDFNGNSFDLKALEDGLCEFRKYESMKEPKKIIERVKLFRKVQTSTTQPWSLSWPLF